MNSQARFSTQPKMTTKNRHTLAFYPHSLAAFFLPFFLSSFLSLFVCRRPLSRTNILILERKQNPLPQTISTAL
eukprot:m.75618 g.75618  ORF g.75618 m.75618 type:complete len:74 (+) comp12454_c0_seq2:297-518(+)